MELQKTKSFSMCFSITVNSILDAAESSVWFTTLNLKSGYWQVEVDPEGQGKKRFHSRTRTVAI